jgi:hypothetical protein
MLRFQEVFMNKTMLLAATAVLALTAGGALAGSHPGLFVKPTSLSPIHPTHTSGSTLYDQNSNFGYGIVSQNFTSGSFGTVYNAAAADDFAVPAGKTWVVKEVDVTGVYFNGSGPANSEIVTFYKNSKGHPGKMVKSFTDNCTDSAGSFDCDTRAKLDNSAGTKKKTYWVSVVVNMPFVTGQGEWGWVQNTNIHGTEANWENPGNGFGTGCTTWAPNSQCLGLAGDYAFELKGKQS